MYRLVNPQSRRELALRMLFQPVGEGVFLRACEADSFRALVAVLLNDPAYETADVESRLLYRLRLAEDVLLLAKLENRRLLVSDRDGPNTINVRSDEPFVRSLHQLGIVSLERSVAPPPEQTRP